MVLPDTGVVRTVMGVVKSNRSDMLVYQLNHSIIRLTSLVQRIIKRYEEYYAGGEYCIPVNESSIDSSYSFNAYSLRGCFITLSAGLCLAAIVLVVELFIHIVTASIRKQSQDSRRGYY